MRGAARSASGRPPATGDARIVPRWRVITTPGAGVDEIVVTTLELKAPACRFLLVDRRWAVVRYAPTRRGAATFRRIARPRSPAANDDRLSSRQPALSEYEAC